MTYSELEAEVDRHIAQVSDSPELKDLLANDPLHVIKYMPTKFLPDTLLRRQLYASERVGFTWGDAIYVAPLAFPLSTMMYGTVGVVGVYRTAGRRFFDASTPRSISLYQEWIRYQSRDYADLTTTIHANSANRELRNAFRTRFQIDCVVFRPDEGCPQYVDVSRDWWIAITHWDASRDAAYGFSSEVTDLKWCAVTPDGFEQQGRGYKAFLHPALTLKRAYRNGHYTTLESYLRTTYNSKQAETVVVCDFK